MCSLVVVLEVGDYNREKADREMNEDSNSKRLIGIKAIADYLEMSPRNVYRWEKELGLPLHRVSGAHGHRV